MLRARSSHRLRREAEKASTSPAANAPEVAGRVADPVDVALVVEPDVRGDARKRQVPARAEAAGDADLAPLEIADRPDRLVREQLVAARNARPRAR